MRPLAGFLFEAACGLAASALILAAVLASYACSSAPVIPPPVIPSHVADDRYCEATRDPLAALPAGVTVPATIAECVTDAECEAAWAEVCAR